jgi:hypothetical protein
MTLLKNEKNNEKNNDYNLPEISDEQQNILSNLKKNNLIINAVAGSGKTTTSMYIAKQYNECKILLLTYNAKLKMETRNKVKSLNLTNIEVHSYHSFCVKYYDKSAITDKKIYEIILNKSHPLKKFSYDIIIIDEAQDISPLYYELICKINNNNNNNYGYAKICIMGDEKQSIYDFNNADERYITNADQLFNFNYFGWTTCKLSTSFRLTTKITDFINKITFKYSKIKSMKESEIKPEYIIYNAYNHKIIYDKITDYLDKGYTPSDIFILTPSLKSPNCPCRKLENYITNNNINIEKQINSGKIINVYVPSSEEEKLDDDVIKDKLVFSTFHQSKGLERKIVIIYNFDNSYFEFYAKSNEPTICPNTLYVAMTRAQEHLILIHHYKNDYLQFIEKNKLKEYCKLNENCKININIKKNKEHNKKININIKKNKEHNKIDVTKLIKFLPCNIINECINYLTITKITKPTSKIQIPGKIKENESVCEINGIAIPAYYEYKKTNKMTILNYLNNYDNIKDEPNEIKKFYKTHKVKLNLINEKNMDDKYLFIATFYNSIRSGYIFKNFQIKDYNWIDKETMEKTKKNIDKLELSKNSIFEKEYKYKKLIGRVDCISENILYEFKCTNELKDEYYLQLACYMYLHMKKNKNNENYQYKLYNIFTDELVEIKCEFNKLEELVNYLFNYYNNNVKIDINEEFLKKNTDIKQKYFNIYI